MSGERTTPGSRWANILRLFNGVIVATSDDVAQTIYTAPDLTCVNHNGDNAGRIVLTSIRIANDDEEPQALTLHIAQPSEKLSVGNLLLPSVMLPGKSLAQFSGLEELLDPGAQIRVFASVPNRIALRLSGELA
jgi:hypothetical protein